MLSPNHNEWIAQAYAEAPVEEDLIEIDAAVATERKQRRDYASCSIPTS